MTFKLGDKGDGVRQLQNDLKALGYAISVVDGSFGQITLKAVIAFQTAFNLKPDGVAGDMTQQKIAKLLQKPTSIISKWGLLPIVQRMADTFLKSCQEKGYDIRIVSGLRTKAQQDVLYAQGRTTAGKIVTNAPYPKSLHNHGLAFDICFNGLVPYPNDDKKWQAIADIGVSIGFTSGYYFKSIKDRPHLEYKNKYTYQQIFDFQYKKEDFN